MAVCRVEKTSNYTVMSNYHLDDKRLSLKARGLLSTILRLPEDWDYTVGGLAALCRDGKDAIRSALEELEAAGYITRQQTRGPDGTFLGNEYVIRETPFQAEPDEDEGVDEGEPLSDYPLPENPSTDNPLTEKPTEPSTNRPSTKITNPPIVPRKRRTREPKKAPDHEPEAFDRFWRLYPRGEDKQGAIAEWDRLKPDAATMLAMSAALYRQLESEEWRRGIGIPYAVRWLRNRRWEDEERIPEPLTGSTCIEAPEVEEW